jgi:hypothetical protein
MGLQTWHIPTHLERSGSGGGQPIRQLERATRGLCQLGTLRGSIVVLGLGADAQEQFFDVPSAVAAAAIADTVAPRIIGTGTEIQFRFKGTIDDRKPTRDWLQAILNSASGYYVWSFGKLRVGCRENASAVSAFTAGNTLFNSLRLGPIKPQFEKLTLSFADQEYQFQSNTVDLTDQDHAARNKRSQNPLAATFPLSGCSTKSQAGRLAIVRERRWLQPLVEILFPTNPASLPLKP